MIGLRASASSATSMLQPAAGDGTAAGGAATGPTADGLMPPVSSLVPRMATVDAITRFVSLVPFLPDSQAFDRADASTDMWATTHQTLEMGAGDDEEHAVMLHNYLTWLESGSSRAAGSSGAGGAAMIASSTMLGGALAAGAGPTPTTGMAPDMSTTGWMTYIVLGRGQPDGDAVYVMRQFRTPTTITTVLINASTGRAYFSEDDTCPLRSVGMVASCTNCWANIQTTTTPCRMSFDLDDARAWAPLFTPQRPYPGTDLLPTVQQAVIYRAPDLKLAWGLESEIHATISAQMRSWRPRFVTRIRGDLTQPLRALCLELEARAAGVTTPNATMLAPEGPTTAAAISGVLASRGGYSAGGMAGGAAMTAGVRDLSGEHFSALERLASRYRVQGFPLQATFTDMETLSRLVQSTGIHRLEEDGVQYGLGVVVVPYPNAVFSVWMYVVALQSTTGIRMGVDRDAHQPLH